MGEGPPPLALKQFILAAGIGEVGGLGARAVYGDRTLSWREFEEAWVCQNLLAQLQEEKGSDQIRSRVTIRRTLALEGKGVFDSEDLESQRPAWIPLDPGPI